MDSKEEEGCCYRHSVSINHCIKCRGELRLFLLAMALTFSVLDLFAHVETVLLDMQVE